MSSLTHAKKAALHAKVDESIGSLCPKRRHLHDAIRGGVLVDALYILLDLHKETVKSEAKGLQELAVAKHDITAFRQELEDARDALAASQAELAEEKERVLEYEKADKENHTLYTKTREKLTAARTVLAQARAELAEIRPALAQARAELAQVRQAFTDTRIEMEEAYKALSFESKEFMRIDLELSQTRTQLHRLKETTSREIFWYRQRIQQLEANSEVEGLPVGILKGML